jgi:hypothetical protein
MWHRNVVGMQPGDKIEVHHDSEIGKPVMVIGDIQLIATADNLETLIGVASQYLHDHQYRPPQEHKATIHDRIEALAGHIEAETRAKATGIRDAQGGPISARFAANWNEDLRPVPAEAVTDAPAYRYELPCRGEATAETNESDTDETTASFLDMADTF